MKLAPLLPKLEEEVGGCSKLPQGGRILHLCKRSNETESIDWDDDFVTESKLTVLDTVRDKFEYETKSMSLFQSVFTYHV